MIVMLNATAAASDGIPQSPVTANARHCRVRCGPPLIPTGPRVSTMRQGVTAKNFRGAGVGVGVWALAEEFRASANAPTMKMIRTKLALIMGDLLLLEVSIYIQNELHASARLIAVYSDAAAISNWGEHVVRPGLPRTITDRGTYGQGPSGSIKPEVSGDCRPSDRQVDGDG